MSLSNFFKYTGGPPPRLYIFSSNSQATIIESPNEVTQLAFLTVGKSNNSISFLSTLSNIGVYDRSGAMFQIGRQGPQSNAFPRIVTSGSHHATEGYWVDGRQVITRNAEVYSSNLYVQTNATLSNLFMHEYEVRSSQSLLQFGVESGYGQEFAFQYLGSSKTTLRIAEQSVTTPRLIVGTPNSNVEVFTVQGRAKIDRGLYVSRPFGSNTLLLSDSAAPNDTVGPRMVVFREYNQNAASTYAGIGFEGGLVYTTASTDQAHKFLITRDRPREVMRIGADTLGNARVGIGFTTEMLPEAALHLKGNARFEGDLFVSGRFEGPENLATLDESGRIRITDLPDRIPLLNSNNKIDDQYLPVANCNLNLYRSSLNVGIGTNVPKQKLHLTGNMYIQQGRLGIGSEIPATPIHVYQDAGTDALYYSQSLAGGDHFLLANSNNSNCFVVTHDGRVGVKKRPDVGYALDVQGGIKATELTIPTLTIETVISSNLSSGGLTTNTTLNGVPGSTKLEGYTVSSERFGVAEITAYPDPDASTVYLKSTLWMTKSAPWVSMVSPNELSIPEGLTRSFVYNALSNIRGYRFQVGALSANAIGLLAAELGNAIPTSVTQDASTGTTGYQTDQIWPYVFSGLRELIVQQGEQDVQFVQFSTNTSNQLGLLATQNSNLQTQVTTLQSHVTGLSNQLVSTSNALQTLQTRLETLENQVAILMGSNAPA